MREFTTTNPDLAEQTWEAVWGMNDRKIWEGRENLGLYCYTKGRYQFRFGLSQSRNISMTWPPWAAWYGATPRARDNQWPEKWQKFKL